MRFINREEELQILEQEYKKDTSSFVVIYGRRRTGKTTLIEKFIENKEAVYFLATLQNEKLQIESFKNVVSEVLNDDLLKSLTVENWETIFKYIATKVQKKLIIVIDEFQYLAQVNSSIPSIFQSIWDNLLKNKNLMLILCGSLIGLMYKTTLGYTSPLYGRRTAQIKLKPMNFKNFKKFFKSLDNLKLLEFYSVIGGIPRYIEIFDETLDVFENIRRNVLHKNSYLYEEPKFILKEEIKDPITYFSILQVISQGEHKIGKIASKLGMQTQNLTSFIEKLIELDILERKVPTTEENPEKSKKGLYFIKDNFFNFWFKYVFPYQNYLETGKYDYVLDKIKSDFHVFESFTFEEIVLEYIYDLDIPFHIYKAGKWWDKDTEIDVVAVGEDSILFGECKYWDSLVGVNVLHQLKEKAKKVDWKKDKRKEYYAVFSKIGFTKELIDLAKKDKSILLFNFQEF